MQQGKSKGNRNEESPYEEEKEMELGEYYQQPSAMRRQRNTYTPNEFRVDLPYFYDKDNVEVYLDWEMKVNQILACHQVSEERKVSRVTLSFQGYVMYW